MSSNDPKNQRRGGVLLNLKPTDTIPEENDPAMGYGCQTYGVDD